MDAFLPEQCYDVTHIVDTNVILVANGRHPGVTSACEAACRDWLTRIMEAGRIALDDGFALLGEYQHKADAQRGRGVGDAFVRWALRHRDDDARCDRIALAPHPVRGYAAFPEDPALADFDVADRMFVALARSHPERPDILQAADSKWLDWAPALARQGVRVRFLCEVDTQRFHQHKFGH
ncbi:hypothetical protein GTZ97_05730 [Aquabacterium fontiphilum]|uniref:hypothetical protein n=1 Tax=Aquabacterium fontiphilum TaxID=450365 RepID=UPI00137736A4|nr:hypothetical protein [Aquabacterium fontiphilum]NBD20170.1 hypothetical protein [Aquabacterium fontiphilum]